MAKLVNDQLENIIASEETLLDDVTPSFGNDLTVIKPLQTKILSHPSKEKPATQALRQYLRNSTGVNPPKVKTKNLRTYIFTELVQLDGQWGEANWEWENLQAGNNMDVEDKEEMLEIRMLRLEGSIEAVFQLGRYFGISAEEMQQCMQNISNSDYEETASFLSFIPMEKGIQAS